MAKAEGGIIAVGLHGGRCEAAFADTLRIFEHIGQAGRLRTGELVELTGSARPTVLRSLALLEERGDVRHVAMNRHDPNAYWTIEDA